jgi:hypothetical protein
MTPDQLDDFLMEIEYDLGKIRDDIRWFKEQEERRRGELVKTLSSKPIEDLG